MTRWRLNNLSGPRTTQYMSILNIKIVFLRNLAQCKDTWDVLSFRANPSVKDCHVEYVELQLTELAS